MKHANSKGSRTSLRSTDFVKPPIYNSQKRADYSEFSVAKPESLSKCPPGMALFSRNYCSYISSVKLPRQVEIRFCFSDVPFGETQFFSGRRREISFLIPPNLFLTE